MQVEQLPYSFDKGALELLDLKIEHGVELMRDEGRTESEDVALAEQHLRGLLLEAGDRAVLPLGSEPIVVADGLESLFPANRWWPF